MLLENHQVPAPRQQEDGALALKEGEDLGRRPVQSISPSCCLDLLVLLKFSEQHLQDCSGAFFPGETFKRKVSRADCIPFCWSRSRGYTDDHLRRLLSAWESPPLAGRLTWWSDTCCHPCGVWVPGPQALPGCGCCTCLFTVETGWGSTRDALAGHPSAAHDLPSPFCARGRSFSWWSGLITPARIMTPFLACRSFGTRAQTDWATAVT